MQGGCLISYALTKANRHCERVGRQHKSNCTFLVADICAGVYWQSCWDSDCKGFKSRTFEVILVCFFAILVVIVQYSDEHTDTRVEH